MSDGDSTQPPAREPDAPAGEAPGDPPAAGAPALAVLEEEGLGSRLRQQARDLREQALAAAGAGDYRRARELDAQIERLGLDNELGHEAAAERESLGPDPVALWVGVAGLLIVVLAWTYALW